MHTPTPDPREDEDDPDVKQPPVPPDQAPDVVPQRDPPEPGHGNEPPLIAASLPAGKKFEVYVDVAAGKVLRVDD